LRQNSAVHHPDDRFANRVRVILRPAGQNCL
jgi:hypothetical protein